MQFGLRADIGWLRTGLLRLQRLLRATTGRHDDALVSVRRLEDDGELIGDFRATLKDVRNRGEARIILDCDWRKVQLVLQQVLPELTNSPAVRIEARGRAADLTSK